MSPTRIGIVVVALAVAVLAGGAAVFLNRTAPTPASDLQAVFAKHPDRAKAKRDAQTLASIGGLAAATIEADGKAANPQFTTAGQVDTLRAELRSIATGGLSYRDDYPELPVVLGAFFASRVGENDGPLTPDRRKEWVAAFAALRDAAAAVAEHL